MKVAISNGVKARRPLRILFTSNTLAYRAGSELFVFDLAVALRKRGHQPIAFSTVLGEVADQLRSAAVPVIDDLGALTVTPDIIHGQHHLELATALLRFPNTPAIHVCHGWLPWEEEPLRFPTIQRYVAVSNLTRERLLTSAIPADAIEIVHNFVDTDRFKPRGRLPSRPRTAAVFSNYISHEHPHFLAIVAACQQLEFEKIDLFGSTAGSALSKPEEVVPGYDVIFAAGRCALEALACGCAVIVADHHGLGGLVAPANLEKLRSGNFGIATTCGNPMTSAGVVAELSMIESSQVETVSRIIRAEIALTSIAPIWEKIYIDAMNSFQASSSPVGISSAASAYLRGLNPIVKNRHAAWNSLLNKSARDTHRIVDLEESLAEARDKISALESIVAEAERRAAKLGDALDERTKMLTEAQGRIASLEAAATAGERQTAQAGRALIERTAELAQAHERIAAIKGTLTQRERELTLHGQRIAAIKKSLSWRFTAPFREMYRPVRQLPTSRFVVRLRAAWRHPLNSRKRKAYRANWMGEYASTISPATGRPTKLMAKLRALTRYPFSSDRRRAYRERLRGDPTESAAIRNSLAALPSPDAVSIDANLFRQHIRNAINASAMGDYVPLSTDAIASSRCDVKLVAYYLPQFHPIPENDAWWGKGFTEWRNVTRAFPVFDGHYQPRVPGELGYYDLRIIDNMRRQVDLAKQHGISAFCFHFYWFGGKRLLELPIESFLSNKELDLQFCLCWANENWSRRWDGGDNEVLMAQSHSPEDDVAFIRYLNKYFQDSRYMKVDGKPVLTIYRPSIIPNVKETVARWRGEALKLGLPGLYLIATNSFGFTDYTACGFDALSEFPPHSTNTKKIQNELRLASAWKGQFVHSYASLVEIQLENALNEGIVHPGIMPSWDNSARRPYDGSIYHGATPEMFARWLKHCVVRARRHRRPERFVFINAWNEWAEGAYLEPDQRYGYAYLAACATAVRDSAVSFVGAKVPTVSAIIPNYNHGQFLKERLASIVEQRLAVSEIIILDDASTDDSREVIARLTAEIDVPVRTVFNETNSRSVFSQWAKGISLASSDLIWICESDDTCDPAFLEALVPYFGDQSIMLAFGRIDFVEEDGRLRPGMDRYMEGAAPGSYWEAPRIESARTWFQGPFGIRNVIPNVGGCLFRRQQVEEGLLAELTSYNVCGDWHFYSHVARGGRIAYDPSARAYFRQHRGNTSVSSFKSTAFYEEHIRVALALRRHYGTDAQTLQSMLQHVYGHYRSVFGDVAARKFEEHHPIRGMLVEQTTRHVLIALDGFQTGGGEIFPIHLANAVARRGYDVSVLINAASPANERIRLLLAPEIPIFTTGFAERMGLQNFFKEFGVNLIHTHNLSLDMWLYWSGVTMSTPYVVTHHGSYECWPTDQEVTAWLLANVDHWVYLSDKNLTFMNGFPRKEAALTKLPNAMPPTETAFPVSRRDLGIEEDAFVFGLASRAAYSKGWDIAIRALRALRAATDRPVHLAFCGDGEDLDTLKCAHRSEPGVHFLGFQDNIQGFYRLCDCCVLPTRYAGESYPLTIIEAVLACIPTIATDVGEIRSLLRINADPMGIVVPSSGDDAAFSDGIKEAMYRMLDQAVHAKLRASVAKHRGEFAMEKLVDEYLAIYERAMSTAVGKEMT